MKWYCINCGWNANVQTWKTEIGERYVCHCGMRGLIEDLDSPKFLNESDQILYESDFDFINRMWKINAR